MGAIDARFNLIDYNALRHFIITIEFAYTSTLNTHSYRLGVPVKIPMVKLILIILEQIDYLTIDLSV